MSMVQFGTHSLKRIFPHTNERKKIVKLKYAVLTGLFAMLLTNCAKVPKSAKEAAEDALAARDYQTALSRAQAIIDNPGSDEDLQSAYLVKGQALLGLSEIDATDSLLEISQTEDKNLFEVLPTMDDLDTATAAADSFELAEGLAPTSRSTSELRSSQQLARMMANFTVVVKMLTRVFDVSTVGVTLTADAATAKDAMDYLYGGSRTVQYYVTNAIDAAQKSGSLTDDQEDLIVTTLTSIFEHLRLIQIALDGSGDYSYDTGTSSGTLNASSLDAEILEVLSFEMMRANL